MNQGFAGLDGPIIIDDSSSYHPMGDELFSIRDRIMDMGLQQPWVILTSDFNTPSWEKNIMFYPSYVIDIFQLSAIPEVEIVRQRSHNLGFIFNRAYYQRGVSVIKMYQLPWFDTCVIKFPTQEFDTSGISEHDRAIFDVKIVPSLPWCAEFEGDALEINHIGFTDCYINFMIESSYPSPLVSEKSIKPFLAGQIPSVMGNSKLSNLMNSWGFDMMENYISQPTHDDIHRNLDELLPQLTNVIGNIKQIWHETLPSRQHNYDWARTHDFKMILEKELLEWLHG